MLETRSHFSDSHSSLEATRVRARELRAESIALRQRLAATRQEHAEIVDCTRALLSAVREQLASLRAEMPEQAVSRPFDGVLKALTILGRDEGDLEEVTDDLIAAYRTAVAEGDDDTRLRLAAALTQIGRHFATQVGPKAAGVVLN